MTALDRLYQEMILEHNRKPRNFKVLEKPTHISHGVNPLCLYNESSWQIGPDWLKLPHKCWPRL